jgi:hypothetical protein
MKVLVPALAAGVLSVSLLGAAHADPRNVVVLAKASASGKKAHVVAVVPDIGTPRRLTVEVVAKPRQKVDAGWVMLCGDVGLMGRNGRGMQGRTPLSIPVDLQPGPCRLTALATLAKKGRVTVTVVARLS